jgi:hypothetical protein
MDGEWVETKMRKMIIYGVVAPKVEHPTMVEKKVSSHIPKGIWCI